MAWIAPQARASRHSHRHWQRQVLEVSREPRPFLDGGQNGYTLLIWNDAGPDEVNAILDRIQKTGARHLTIPYFGCQTDIHSSDVGGCQVIYRTSAPDLAKMALAKGFSVSFLPIVETPHWDWRGLFDPTDVDAWFRTYGVWIKQVAREAKALGSDEFIVSSEMTQLYRYEDRWAKLIREVRDVFDGPLIATVNWGDLNHRFWSETDAIGVSAYYPLSQKADPSQQELDVAWQGLHDQFVALSRQWKRPIHLTEVGYPSVAWAARSPWLLDPSAPSDFALQARCFEAFRKAWEGEPTLARANIWATSAESPSASDYLFGFETLGKPAETILHRFFTGQ